MNRGPACFGLVLPPVHSALLFGERQGLRNSVINRVDAGAFGFAGFIPKRLNLLIIPIILATVPGGIMEAELRIAMMGVESSSALILFPIAAEAVSAISGPPGTPEFARERKE